MAVCTTRNIIHKYAWDAELEKCYFHMAVVTNRFELKGKKILSITSKTPLTTLFFKKKYGRVSFCEGSFYDDSLLRPLPSQTEHSRLVVHHCSNSGVLSVLRALVVLFRCARLSSCSALVQFF
jgi:hypothetical protein